MGPGVVIEDSDTDLGSDEGWYSRTRVLGRRVTLRGASTGCQHTLTCRPSTGFVEHWRQNHVVMKSGTRVRPLVLGKNSLTAGVVGIRHYSLGCLDGGYVVSGGR